MEEICQERELFKKRINSGIKDELRQFGLKIYNANIKELTDAPNSNYFEVISRKAHESASNNARVDVAQVRKSKLPRNAETNTKQRRNGKELLAKQRSEDTKREKSRRSMQRQLWLELSEKRRNLKLRLY